MFEVVTPNGLTDPIVRVSAANVSFALGDGTTNYLSLSNGRGNLVLGKGGIEGVAPRATWRRTSRA